MPSSRKKLAVIDGKSVFYRGYYAMPNLSTKDGTPTGGVYGFTAMSLELLKKLKPDYVAVAWDKPKTNIRRRVEMYPAYKAGRKPAPPDFYAQIPLLHELLEAFNWPLLELDDYEADDIMGALAEQAKAKNIETMLITSDLDALQLINGHTKVYALKKGFSNIEEYHPESFEAKYGIKVEQFLDLKALKGDSSDNIPGVPGIGEKTAIQLLQDYETLDGVYENLALLKESVSKKLEAGKKSAYLSKEIARLWTDAPVKLDFKAMDAHKLDTAHLQSLLQKLEFRSLLRSLPENMRAEVPTTDSVGGVELKLPKLNIINTNEQLTKLSFQTKDNIFIHTRCAGKHGKDPRVIIIGNEKEVHTLNLDGLNIKNVSSKLSSVGAIIGYDTKSDIKLLLELGLPAPKVKHDVLVGAFLINALLREQSLTELAKESLGFEGAELENMPDEDFISRSAELIAVIIELYKTQSKELDSLTGVAKLADVVEWPVIPVLANMERTGIKLDADYLNKFSVQLEGQISDIEQQIYGHADQEFNISSPAQLADILYVKLALPTQFVKKGKTGYSTAANELAKLKDLHPIISLISAYREVTKLKNTYVDTLPKMVDEQSRVHTTFNLTTAQTGRLSSLDPNLQNIPVRTELGKRIRNAFIASDGNILISADYSQFELRLAAVLADDKDLIEQFNKDVDIHIATAAAVYGIKPELVNKQQRYEAKAVNFGILYGQGPHGLAEGTGMTFAAAREFIQKYFEIRPKFKEYIEKTRKQALEQGYVETLLGRRRPSPDVKSSNFVVREAAYRAAVNMPVQGTAADLTKLAMVKINEQITDGCKILLQIHDSILLECPEGEANKYGKLLKDVMEDVYKLPVKLKVDISKGHNWGEL
jgi:DNA polymerase-1